ncbi:MerR family transcriptional regulator [Clostridium sp. MCC353]|uniref:MerR family transcriptional regulator n=1 Tax=Clostridium sp. MCC353 TaxID=2592646 RepID=UPI001C014E98|nr:effector binding domain-containing protein [Clostridium sp. MCC353]MBT9779451.1 MerR family transcriptional regulator [Clostridium sp. MCC353]
MKEMTISQVSQSLGISTRMLRYYEKAGLISSSRREGYSYRIYDDNTVTRIKQILLLRKLRIPVRQIETILNNTNAVGAIEIFQQNIDELDEEITALSTIRNILNHLVEELSKATELPLKNIISQDDTLLTTIESLELISINFKEEQTVDKLKKADERLSKINDVRIIYLPPAVIAASHYIGDDPELHANFLIEKFIKESSLRKAKPDLRHFGFNHPNPVDETGFHGYEAWVTIPDDMEVPEPLEKKRFCGGLYAAHMIKFGNFNEWGPFLKWVMKDERYEFAGDLQDQEHMCGLLEEHLNFYSHLEQPDLDLEQLQLDLLIPIKEKHTETRKEKAGCP